MKKEIMIGILIGACNNIKFCADCKYDSFCDKLYEFTKENPKIKNSPVPKALTEKDIRVILREFDGFRVE